MANIRIKDLTSLTNVTLDPVTGAMLVEQDDGGTNRSYQILIQDVFNAGLDATITDLTVTGVLTIPER